MDASQIELDPRFGDRALRLAARALPAPDEHGRARVALRADALSSGERALLGAAAGASFVGDSNGGLQAWFDPAALARLAPHSHAAACLQAAHLGACLHAAHALAAGPTGRPLLMGVLNVTPDSFSDGGLWLDPGAAAERAAVLEAEGADLLDLGGESTRPGAAPVAPDEEARRVLPALERIRSATRLPIAVNTRNAGTARAALERGASWINDVSAGRHDPAMLPLVAERGATYVAMHMRGTPADMQQAPAIQAGPRGADPVAEILEELRARARACLEAGIAPEQLVVDPGIGFGKRDDENLALLRRLSELRSLGLPLLIGVSRKSFLGRISGEPDAARRDVETAAALATCVQGGASILRVHAVGDMRRAALVAAAIAARSPLTRA